MKLKNPIAHSPSTISPTSFIPLSFMKPYILYSQTHSKTTAKQFNKRLPRYVHELQAAWDDHTLIQNSKHLKLVQVVEFAKHQSFSNRHAIKALKQLQKHIKQTTGTTRYLEGLPFYLPYLSKYALVLDDPETYEPLIYCRTVTQLVIYWPTDFVKYCESHADDIWEKVEEFEWWVYRIAMNFKRVQHLKVCIRAPVVELLDWFGYVFEPHFHNFESLKTFVLQDGTAGVLDDPIIDSQSAKYVLNQVTHFDMYSEFHRLKSLKNLVELSLSTCYVEHYEMPHLIHLKNLDNLKRLTLSSENCEPAFFKYFTLPKSLEYIKLLIWGNEKKKCCKKNIDYNKFVNQWVGLEMLKELRLTVANKSYSLITICGRILRQISNLETFYYEHKYYDSIPNKSLDLGDLLKGLKSSNKTLKTVEIKACDISLSYITDVNFELPQLKSLNMKSVNEHYKNKYVGKIYEGYNMLRLLTDSLRANTQVSPVSVTLNQILIKDNKELSNFFEAMEKIPYYNIDLNLEVIINKAEPKAFTTSLYNLLEQNKIQGSLYISVPEECVDTLDNLNNLEQAALRNTSLRHFKMKMLSEFVYFEVKKRCLLHGGNGYTDLSLCHKNQ